MTRLQGERPLRGAINARLAYSADSTMPNASAPPATAHKTRAPDGAVFRPANARCSPATPNPASDMSHPATHSNPGPAPSCAVVTPTATAGTPSTTAPPTKPARRALPHRRSAHAAVTGSTIPAK